jgi:pimeloyl-ACP methyl ester carboxylesterase
VPAPPRPRRFRAGALPLHALEWNPDGAVPVVLLHGWLDHAHSFDGVCAALPASLRCLALDFRGHGQSGHLAEGTGYEVGQYLADVHALLADAGLSRAHLVGHSLGGVVALAFAAAAPARVASVSVVDNAGPYGGGPDRAVERLRSHVADLDRPARRATYPDVDAATQRLLARSPGMPHAVAAHLCAHGVEEVPGGVAFRFDPRLRRAFSHTWDSGQVEALLRAVEAPVQLLLGEAGHLGGADKAGELAGRVAWLRAGPPRWFPGGHHLHLEQPAEVAGALAAWVARHG